MRQQSDKKLLNTNLLATNQSTLAAAAACSFKRGDQD